mmetsp:Transcript_103854/g.179365  ORF Transcript_103854/g.179365 Transcript_103854/m.179365 type:complete len:355 (-) Transcript_103854:89-1153(-)
MSKHGVLRKRRSSTPPTNTNTNYDDGHNDIVQYYSAWYGCLRLLACAVNVCLILAMYLEYLLAADLPEIHPQCSTRGSRWSLSYLDFADCFHRYTFSESMLRQHNLEIFCVLGTCVAVCFVLVEYKRIRYLQSLLQALLVKIEVANADDDVANISIEGVTFTLRALPVYLGMMCSAFINVLLLTPFHLKRPLLHYGCVAVTAGSMFAGVCIYAALPLRQIVGLGSGSKAGQSLVSDDLQSWAKQHERTCQLAFFVIALHFVLPATVGLHHLLWVDLTGRIWGACEVLTILSYQFFVGSFAYNELKMQRGEQEYPSPAKETSNVNIIQAFFRIHEKDAQLQKALSLRDECLSMGG